MVHSPFDERVGAIATGLSTAPLGLDVQHAGMFEIVFHEMGRMVSRFERVGEERSGLRVGYDLLAAAVNQSRDPGDIRSV